MVIRRCIGTGMRTTAALIVCAASASAAYVGVSPTRRASTRTAMISRMQADNIATSDTSLEVRQWRYRI